MIAHFTLFNPLSFPDLCARVLFAFAAGTAMGWEREGHGRAAGLKTMILACVASCIAMILSEVYYLESFQAGGMFRPDRGRMAAGILTGIGFLGAGAILRKGNAIRGVTTGAALWMTTIVGMAFGSRQFGVGLIGVGMALLVLYLLPLLEMHLKRDAYCIVKLVLPRDAVPEDEFRNCFLNRGASITGVRRNIDLQSGEVQLEFGLKYRKSDREEEMGRGITEDLMHFKGLRRIAWE